MDELIEYRRFLISKRRSPATIRVRLLHVRRLREAHPNLFELTQIDLENYLLSKGVKWQPETVNAVVSSIRGFYGWAERFGHITKNPSTYLENVRVPKREAVMATESDVLQGLRTAPHPSI